ncbi:Hypothetical predicted protein [Xyrichtys novacula]|uniref:Uncharacterized protein n=1 Tax=Xyrichtys novacula TaxID=13765 RepID=A0AAV1G9Z2_XYRNO|nr:Hypothetical predicted protein [Xyrichtys novacula]
MTFYSGYLKCICIALPHDTEHLSADRSHQNDCSSHPQCADDDDPGTTKSLLGHKRTTRVRTVLEDRAVYKKKKKRKRIKIKGWIWKQLQRINAGASVAGVPPLRAKMCGDKAGAALEEGRGRSQRTRA